MSISVVKIAKLCCWAALFSTSKSNAEHLNVASDIWCPYICESNNAPGYLVELTKAIYLQHNITLKLAPMPYARALDLAQKNKIDIVLGVTHEELSNYKLLRSRLTIGQFSNDFFVYGNNKWRYTSNNGLLQYLAQGNKVAIIKGYTYGDYLDMLIKARPEYFHIAYGDTPLETNLEMLAMGRVKLVVEARASVMSSAPPTIKSKLVYAGTEGQPISLHVGFAPQTQQKYLTLLDQGIENYRASGQLATLLAKYGITDWAPSKPVRQ